jgi:hypothetical protein
MSGFRNFEPGQKWAMDDGTLTERAKGWTRSVFDYIGATDGRIPVTSVGGDGTSTTTFLRSDGTFAIPDYPVGGNPTATVGLTVSNGTSNDFMRADAAPALDVGIVPTWTGAHTFTAATVLAGVTAGAVGATSLTTTAEATVGTGFGCNGKTAQTAAAVGAAVVTTAATNVVPYGYATQAQADDIVTRINTIRSALIAMGILV